MINEIHILLVFAGFLLLGYSLLRVQGLCAESELARGWKGLRILIACFAIGYIFYIYNLYRFEAHAYDTIITLILFGCSVFVLLVVRNSTLSIHDVKRVAALERHNALHDTLTNLPNRDYLYQSIGEHLLKARDTGSRVAVLMMDLDRFKEINDTLGHHVGDRVLKKVAPRLKEVVRDADVVARLGGDEFAVVLPSAELETAITISNRIVEVMKETISVDQHHLKVGISIGICLYPDHADDSDTLLQHADVAMYNAKRGATGHAVYDAGQDTYSVNRLNLTHELGEAIQQDKLALYYQPIINIHDLSLYSVEALARWQYTDGEFIPPEDFIALAEQTGLIQSLTQWVLHKSIGQLAEWHEQGIDCLMSVNLSMSDVQNPKLPELVREMLEQAQVPPDRLILEITESSMMMESQLALEVMGRLDELGVTLAIDDFGTGYSSLAYLKQLPAKVLKIDRSFIMDMMEDENDAVIVRSTIDLAHNMGKKVVAEGVEDQETLDILEILRCDRVQGYHIGYPMPAYELPDWLLRLQAEEMILRTRPA